MKINNTNFINKYIHNLNNTFANLDKNKIIQFKKILLNKIKKKKNIYVCGNGGSSSVSNHFLCDFNKGIKQSSNRNLLKPKIISLTSNTDLITAIANDINFDHIFSYQIENYGAKGDLLILFSCSGTSKNIINAYKFSKKKNIDIISIIGFSENKELKKNSKIYINLNIKNYGICEDIFQSLMHIISQMIRLETSNKKIKIL